MNTVGRLSHRFTPCASPGVTVLILAGGLSATEAFAQVPDCDSVGAKERLRRGVTAKERGDWRTACERFRESMDLCPSVSAQFKIANCDERAGNLVAAWYGYRTALTMNGKTGDEKRRSELEKWIKTAIDVLEPKVAILRISVSPNGPEVKLEIEQDDASVAPSTVLGEALAVQPGNHKIVVCAPGFVEQRVEVTAIEGKTIEAAINLVPTPDAAKPLAPDNQTAIVPQGFAPVPQRPSEMVSGPSVAAISDNQTISPNLDDRPNGSWGQKQTAIVIGGAGVATLGMAAYFGIRTLYEVGQMSQYKNPGGKTYSSLVYGPHDSAIRSQRAGLALAGIGTAMLGVSIALYATAPKGRVALRSSAAPRFVVGIAPAVGFVRGDW